MWPGLPVCLSCHVEALGLPDKLGTVPIVTPKAVPPPWSDPAPALAIRPGSLSILWACLQ